MSNEEKKNEGEELDGKSLPEFVDALGPGGAGGGGGRGGGKGAKAKVDPPRGGETPALVALVRPKSENQDAVKLFKAIDYHTECIGYKSFDDFIRRACCGQLGNVPSGPAGLRRARLEDLSKYNPQEADRKNKEDPLLSFGPGVDAYAQLKLAAEMFLLLRCGVCPDPTDIGGDPDCLESEERRKKYGDIFDVSREDGGDGLKPADLAVALKGFLGSDRAGYIDNIIGNLFADDGFKPSPLCPTSVGYGPCLLELIWSYWHEEGMLAQTMNAITLRFQNVRVGRGRDPLAELEIDPLRPLSGILWGYLQDQPNQLTVARRAYEYSHEYGLTLAGKAVANLRPADTRSKFLQSFHDLLRMADVYYREAADTTVIPDPFPLLIALRDLHLIMAEGAHNQFRDLPWTARVEMLMQQWILARKEMRDFLRGRIMVPYAEPWMGAVDAMKKLQGWSDTNVTHFRDLGVFGERILLSIRHIDWNLITDPQGADAWVTNWRPEVQGYIHAYRAVTGISLADEAVNVVSHASDPRYAQPSQHLRNRLREQHPRAGAGRAGRPV